MSRIAKLRIRNILGLKAMEYDGKDIELCGKKGVGKSSFIEAIKICLTNRSDREVIVMQGETEGEIFLQTDTGLTVHRKFRTNKSDYKSIKEEGDKVEKTEAHLRGIFTELQINPLEFSKMDANEQNRIILDLIDFKWDMNWIKEQFGEIPIDVNYEQNILCVLHDIQANDGYYFTKREELNRDARNKKAFIEEIGQELPKGYDVAKWREANLGEVYKKIEAIRTKNEQIIVAKSMVQSRDSKIKEFQSTLEIKKGDIERDYTAVINNIDLNIKEIQDESKEDKNNLQIAISNIDKKAVEDKHNLEEEIRQLEAKIKERRQDILNISSETNALIEQSSKISNDIQNNCKSRIEVQKLGAITAENNRNNYLELAQKTYEANIAGLEGEIKQHEALATIETTPFDELQQEADNTEKMKAFINEYNRMVSLQDEFSKIISHSEDLTQKIEKARTLPGEILANCNIPIAGLTIKDGAPLINGLPISNLSDGERFELCVDITVKNEKSLKIILLNGIECLPSDDRDNLYKRLKDNGVQFIASRTTDDDLLTVIEL